MFTSDPRNRKRQKYCPKRTCKAAGNVARQRRWLAQAVNRDYFRGPEQVQRGGNGGRRILGIGGDIGESRAVRYKTH